MSAQQVLVARSNVGGRRVFHIPDEDGDPKCAGKGTYRLVDREIAERMTREGRPCMNCLDGRGMDEGDANARMECPFCGARVKALANHLRECDDKPVVAGGGRA